MLFSPDPQVQQRLKQFYVHVAHFLEARRQAAKFRAGAGAAPKGGQGKQSTAA
jgi:hypothetical protein